MFSGNIKQLSYDNQKKRKHRIQELDLTIIHVFENGISIVRTQGEHSEIMAQIQTGALKIWTFFAS